MVGTTQFAEKRDILKFVSEENIKILNLCHIPEDGKLKTLSFSAADNKRVEEILELGERVDGSSLFSFIEAEKSDIYVAPTIGKGFVNPFSSMPTLNLLCEYLDENGKPLDVAPRNVLARAEAKLHSSNGIVLKALAELEFYVIAKQLNEPLFLGLPDKNYHESAPFTKFENVRNEILVALSYVGVATKYAHSEVGSMVFSDGTVAEQHEVELKPQDLTDMADEVAIAKWVIRNVCARHNVSASFSPKISLEHAGTGMHIHLCAVKNGRNIIAGSDGDLSVEAKRMIGGILKFAPSLSAFGNPTPVSYLRFIARKESPLLICWSLRNRLALIRVPLWWRFRKKKAEETCLETFEYRAPDAFANPHFLLAGIALAVNYGLKNVKEAAKASEDLHVEKREAKEAKCDVLPLSCYESAKNLEKHRLFYEADNVFPRKIIDKKVEKLYAYGDRNLRKILSSEPAKVEEMLKQYLHYL